MGVGEGVWTVRRRPELALRDSKFAVDVESRVDTEARSSNPSMSLSTSGTGGTWVIWKRDCGGSEPKTCNPSQTNQRF